MKPLSSIPIFSAILLCLTFYGFFAIRKDCGPEFGVNVDLSMPISIVWPCEVSIVGDSGEKGIRIAPKVGRGWKNEAGGQAIYKFFIPQDGKYTIWAYCLWFDECTNAIFAKVDDLDKAIIGNDPIYNKWHWVRGFDVRLNKGTNSLKLSNHSDHIAVQNIVFLNSAFTRPQQSGIIFSDIFYDGFDGCDQGNFTSWRQISGSWFVKNPDSKNCLIENSLIGQSVDEAFIIYEANDWANYCLDIATKLLPADSKDYAVGICFGVKDAGNFYQVKISPIGNNTAQISLLKREIDNLQSFSEFVCPFKINKWQHIHVSLNSEYIEIKLSENEPVKVKGIEKIYGGIGLFLKGNITVYFDDVHIRKTGTNFQTDH